MAQKIGIIGNGNVGSALREGLTKAGHEVDATGKDPAHVRKVVQDADVVFLAVPFGERKNAIKEAGDLKGKVLVDVTNALDDKMDYALDLKKSGAEEVQEMAKGAKVVKAFNTVFAPRMKDGKVKGEKLTVLAAGDDRQAKEQVLALAKDIGFDGVDAGALKDAKWLETLAVLNIKLGYGQDIGTDAGFRFVHPRLS